MLASNPDSVAFKEGSTTMLAPNSMLTSLVSADGGGSAHGLSSSQVAHQVVVVQHALHAVGQCNGDSQRQALRYGHHLHQHTSALLLTWPTLLMSVSETLRKRLHKCSTWCNVSVKHY